MMLFNKVVVVRYKSTSSEFISNGFGVLLTSAGISLCFSSSSSHSHTIFFTPLSAGMSNESEFQSCQTIFLSSVAQRKTARGEGKPDTASLWLNDG